LSETAPDEWLASARESATGACIASVEARNARLFDEEVLKLDRWSEDLKLGLERELRDLDKALRETRRVAAAAATLAEKLEAQRQVRRLEVEQSREVEPIFRLRWHLT
jgi:adenine-specific DNA-methyltransferase